MSRPEVSVVVESYNHAEGSSGLDRMRIALETATRMLDEHGNAALLVTDAAGDPELAAAAAQLPPPDAGATLADAVAAVAR